MKKHDKKLIEKVMVWIFDHELSDYTDPYDVTEKIIEEFEQEEVQDGVN
jgi:hypothetical protein